MNARKSPLLGARGSALAFSICTHTPLPAPCATVTHDAPIPQPVAPSAARVRLNYLHGLRGLAVLYVVVFHLLLNCKPRPSWTAFKVLTEPLMHGNLAVSVLLTLSGFLMAMPFVRSGNALTTGPRRFVQRRGIRLLVPYYGAYGVHMIFYPLLAYALFPLMGRAVDPFVADQLATGYAWHDIAAHILMIHNMSPVWVDGMSAIFWTMACEFHIMLLFAFVLAPLWTRFGIVAPMLLCTALAALLVLGMHTGVLFYHISWLPLVYAAGMATAAVLFGAYPLAARMRAWPWGRISLAFLAATITTIVILQRTAVPADWAEHNPTPFYAIPLTLRWISNTLGALWTGAIILMLAKGHPALATADNPAPAPAQSRPVAALRRFLETPRLQALGVLTYSLYLTHGLVLILLPRLAEHYLRSRTLRVAVILIVGVALSLLVAKIFRRIFEEPFLSPETRAMHTTTPAAEK